MFRKLLPLVLLVSILLVAIPTVSVQAQTCPYATIIDLTGTLDQGEICQASRRLAEFGYSVFIYYTSESFNYRIDQNGDVISEDWYTRLDQVEQQNGQWSTHGPLPNLFALEVAAAPLRTIYVGNASSPLEKNWPQIKDSLLFLIDSDPTRAFVKALEKATEIQEASVPAAPTKPEVKPTNPSAPTGTPGPTAIPLPTPTPKPPFFTTTAGRNFLAGLVNFVIGLVVLIGLVALYILWFRPWNAQRKRIAVLRKQLDILKVILFDLKNRCEGLFGGEKLEDTAIYRLWFVNGGQQQKEDMQVRQVIERARQAYQIVMRDAQLGERLLAQPNDEDGLERLITDLEEVYLLFVGTSARVLNMNSREIEVEFNPLLITGERYLDDPLVQQAQEMTRKWSGGALQIKPMFANARDVDQRGILGSISEVKQLLFNLVQAHDQAPGRVDDAKRRRKEVGDQTKPPFGMTEEEMFDHIDQAIAASEEALRQQLWVKAEEQALRALDSLEKLQPAVVKLVEANNTIDTLQVPEQPQVPNRSKIIVPIRGTYEAACQKLAAGKHDEAIRLAEAVITACNRVAELIPQYLEALNRAAQRRVRIGELQNQGFSAPVSDALGEVDRDIKTVRQSLTEGNYPKVVEYIREISEDSNRALQIMETLVAVYEKNQKELKRLSVEVARVQKFANSEALKAWASLQKYPQGNWQDVAGFFGEADATLSRLFDDSADADDLASRINTLNESKKQQAVVKAEAELVQAFLDLEDAERKLKEVIEQRDRVLEAESAVKQTLTEIKVIHASATQFIAEHDRMIEEEMEELLHQAEISLAQARKQIASREFLPAQSVLATARELIVRAQSHAKDEVTNITRLYDQMSETRLAAEKIVGTIQVNLANMTPIARKASTSATVDEAASHLRRGRAVETKCASKEDHNLESSLQNAVSLYQQAKETAEDAARRMQADLTEYHGLIKEVRYSISSASSAIATASRYVSNSDAGNAGYSALQRAQSTLPESPREGETIDSLRRRRKAAESASTYAQQAQAEAQRRIRAAEAAREAERQRQLEAERQRREAERRAEEARQEARRRQEAAESARRHTQMMESMRHTSISSPTRHTSIGGGTRRH